LGNGSPPGGDRNAVARTLIDLGNGATRINDSANGGNGG